MQIKKNKIMVVEDEKITMLFIRETLEEYGYDTILEYGYGSEIIDAIKQGNIPDLILMDINIRGSKDGIQTATEVLRLCDIPIVFMSAHNDNQTIKEVLDVSLYGFISKPFNERELYIALEVALRNFSKGHKSTQEIGNRKIKLYDECYYELETQRVYLHEELVTLAHNQQVLLETLVENINSVVDNTSLSYNIWGTKIESHSSLRTVIYLLRKKLQGIQISSQSKHGYRLTGYSL